MQFLLTYIFRVCAFFLILLYFNSINAQNRLPLIQYKLANGFEVFIQPDFSGSTIYGNVAVRAGGKYDPKDATGMGHYLEHMLFKGTEQMGTNNYEKEKLLLDEITRLYDELGKTTDPGKRKEIQLKINEVSIQSGEYAIANDIDRLLNAIGSSGVNAFTSYEVINYFNSFPPHELEKWLDIYSHRFQKPVFRLFQSELETVYEEKNRSMDNYRDAIEEAYLKKFYKVHPYGQQTILGETEHLKNPSLTKMYEYFNTYNVANNMALILVGPIDVEKAKVWIEKKFSVLPNKPVPEYPKFHEKDFAGREFFEVSLSPMPNGIIGYRTPPNLDPDETALNIISTMLSNSGNVGLLDQLVLDGSLISAIFYFSQKNDYSDGSIYYVPNEANKITLEKGEKLIMDKLSILKEGKFSDEFLESSKNNLIKTHYLILENAYPRTFQILDVFISGRKWDDIQNYPDLLKKVSKEEIIRVANKYFGENKLVMYSRVGTPPKDKLDKPPFKPVIPDEKSESPYGKYFKTLPSGEPVANFVDFKKDISIIPIGNEGSNKHFYYSANKINKIANFDIDYKIGYNKIKNLNLLCDYLNLSCPSNSEPHKFKEKLYNLAWEVSFSCTKDRFIIQLNGLEENAAKALKLINEFMNDPIKENKILKQVIDTEKSNRAEQEGEPAAIGRFLKEYLIFKDNSSYLKRSTSKELSKIKVSDLIGSLKTVLQTEVNIHYSGTLEAQKALSEFLANYPLPERCNKGYFPTILPITEYEKPTILFHNKEDARQCQIYFYVPGEKVYRENIPLIDYFNAYFGSDMSSLVFQEIREYRSLAYSTTGDYKYRITEGNKGYFTGYVGCQADKTLESIEVYYKLLTDMPQKIEREKSLKNGLIQKAYSSKPSFRSVTSDIEFWKLFGYQQDPNRESIPAYKMFNFNDIVRLYEKHIKNKPISIAIVGNEKFFDLKSLSKYGTIKKLSDKDFYSR